MIFRKAMPFPSDTSAASGDIARISDPGWRTIFDGDPARVAILDGHGTIAEVNQAWREHHGRDNAGLPWAGSNYFDLLMRNGVSVSLRIAEAVSEVLDGVRDDFDVDYACHESTDGRWTALRVYPWTREGRRWAVVRHADATVVGNALERSALLSAVLADLAAPVIISDLAHRVVHWNAGAETLYGYGADQARGMRLEHLIAPHGIADELGLGPLDGRGRAVTSAVHRRRDGQRVSVDLQVRLLPDRDGRPGFFAVAATSAEDERLLRAV